MEKVWGGVNLFSALKGEQECFTCSEIETQWAGQASIKEGFEENNTTRGGRAYGSRWVGGMRTYLAQSLKRATEIEGGGMTIAKIGRARK